MIRRNADSNVQQTFWNAIKKTESTNDHCGLDDILNEVENTLGCRRIQAQEYLKQVTDDRLIIELHQGDLTTYIFPPKHVPEAFKDDCDWYCFECHRAGPVTKCSECYRVYHQKCALQTRAKLKEFQFIYQLHVERLKMSTVENNGTSNQDRLDEDHDNSMNSDDDSIKSLQYNRHKCSVCNRNATDYDSIKDCEVNYLLKFIFQRINTWLPSDITKSLAEDSRPEWLTEEDFKWRSELLLCKKSDFDSVRAKLENKEYKRMFEFLEDIETIEHNVAVFHGPNSVEYEAAKFMVKDCKYDIKEILNCMDCYKYSNEKINSKWFCLPCRNPHILVWAKQTGYPYWPAKVMHRDESTVDVRFFGGKYERANIPFTSIKPISVDINTLQVKRTSAFNKAVQELKLHQKLLKTALSQGHCIIEKKSEESSLKRKRFSEESTNGKINQSGEISSSNEHLNSIQENNENCSESCSDDLSEEEENEKSDLPYEEVIEKMKKRMLSCTDKNTLIQIAVEGMQKELARLGREHDSKIKKLKDRHEQEISDTKRKQWCYNCGKESQYYCCWNTSYCSPKCQTYHWQLEHRRVCRRKRS